MITLTTNLQILSKYFVVLYIFNILLVVNLYIYDIYVYTLIIYLYMIHISTFDALIFSKFHQY